MDSAKTYIRTNTRTGRIDRLEFLPQHAKAVFATFDAAKGIDATSAKKLLRQWNMHAANFQQPYTFRLPRQQRTRALLVSIVCVILSKKG